MSQSKILRFATIAAMFEMYSIAMYYFFAPVLGVNFFFKAFDSSPFFIFALFIFADYLARPIGAMVLGPYGDKCGRKQSLRISLILLMIGALAIACMPTYAVVGMAAPILVLVARVLQGFAAGGNTPGLITMAIEASETGQTGYCVARVFLGLVFGALLAYLVYTNLVFWTANTAYQPYIWRIGIGISGVLMMIPLFMLMRVEEYPEFLSQKAEKQLSQTPLDEFIRISGWFLLDALGGLAAVFVVLYMAFYAMPSYFESTVYLPMGEILLYYAAMLILMAFLLPLIGRLVDHSHYRRLMMAGCLGILIFSNLTFYLISHHDAFYALIALALMMAFALMIILPYIVLMSVLVTMHYRFTGLAMILNISYVAFMALSVFLFEFVRRPDIHFLNFAYAYLIIATIVSMVFIFRPKTYEV